jgi:hypothetical protein
MKAIKVLFLACIALFLVSCGSRYKEENGKWVIIKFPQYVFQPLDDTWEELPPPIQQCELFFGKKGGSTHIGVFLYEPTPVLGPKEVMDQYTKNYEHSQITLLQPLMPYRKGLVARCTHRFTNLGVEIQAYEENVVIPTRTHIIGFTLKRKMEANDQGAVSEIVAFMNFCEHFRDVSDNSLDPGSRFPLADYPYTLVAPPGNWEAAYPPTRLSVFRNENYALEYQSYSGATITVYVFDNGPFFAGVKPNPYDDRIKLFTTNDTHFKRTEIFPPVYELKLANDITVAAYATLAQSTDFDERLLESSVFVMKPHHLLAFILRKDGKSYWEHKNAAELLNSDDPDMRDFKNLVGSLQDAKN